MKRTGASSTILHPLILPKLTYSLSCTTNTTYLLSAGVELWLTVLRNIPYVHATTSPTTTTTLTATTYTSNTNTSNSNTANNSNVYDIQYNSNIWLNLFSTSYINILNSDMLEDNEDYLEIKAVFFILETYLILYKNMCIQQCSGVIMYMYMKYIGQLPPRLVPYFIRPLEVAYIICPNSIHILLKGSELLPLITQACLANLPLFNTFLHTYVEPDVSVTSYLTILCQGQNYDPDFIYQLSNILYNTYINNKYITIYDNNISVNSILYSILDLIIDKYDCLGYSPACYIRKRIWASALLSYYTNNNNTLNNTHNTTYTSSNGSNSSMNSSGMSSSVYFLELLCNMLGVVSDVMHDEQAYISSSAGAMTSESASFWGSDLTSAGASLMASAEQGDDGDIRIQRRILKLLYNMINIHDDCDENYDDDSDVNGQNYDPIVYHLYTHYINHTILSPNATTIASRIRLIVTQVINSMDPTDARQYTDRMKLVAGEEVFKEVTGTG